MTCPSATGVVIEVLGQRFTVTPETVGLPRDLVEAIRDREPEEQRRAIEAVLYGFTVAFTDATAFRNADGSKTRFTVTTDQTGRTALEIGDLT